MKSIVHTVYRRGSAGLSNLIMSVELGVVLASLTDRVLILKDNSTPIANIVRYENLVRNTYPSRVTDLIDLGVPWIDADQINLAAFAPMEICDKPAWNCVCYLPAYLSTDSKDFRHFAGDRTHFFTVGEELQHVPALLVSGGAEAGTLSFYSTFFYLDRAAQLEMHDALRRMKPKPELAAFADRVAQDLGVFNAVHIRRGDFKKTGGVTTLDRTSAEAIEAMDHHFSRDERLVILTDEADDPFFDEIKASYRDIVFLDWHILRNFGQQFNDLPTHDSVALAYISQLVAAQSGDFMGTMTSTFTALVQRFRGNLGKDEPFKFLWNELPPLGAKVEPGRHAFGEDVPLDKGVMVEEFSGPYAWNRVNQRLNTGWMREWPESFLDEDVMLERAHMRETFATAPGVAKRHGVSFLGHTVNAGSNDAELSSAIGRLFASMRVPPADDPIAEVSISASGPHSQLLLNRAATGPQARDSKLLRSLYREVVRQFIFKNPQLIWLHASCAASEEGAIALPGSWGRGKSTLALRLYDHGWSFLSDDIVPLDPATAVAIPFPATPQVRSGSRQPLPRDQLSSLSKSAVPIDAARVAGGPRPVSMIVFPRFHAGSNTELTPISPGQAVGGLLENCLSFPENTDATVQALCAMVERTPTYSLSFADPAAAVNVLIETHKSMRRAGGRMALQA
jgi:hypothetical protein